MSVVERRILKEDIRGNRSIAYTLLQASHPLFLDVLLTEEEEAIVLVSDTEHLYDWSCIQTLDTEEKLRYLINIGHIFECLKDQSYSYVFSPNHLVFDLNATPFLVDRGIVNQVEPYEPLSLTEFIQAYQAMIISLLDKRSEYESLVSGKLPFYKGNLFCEQIKEAADLEKIQDLLQGYYEEEKEKNRLQFTKMKNQQVSLLKGTTITSVVVAILSLIGILYLMLLALPRQEMISSIRLSFINQDYSSVIHTVKQTDSKSFTQEDKYMIAYAVMMTEPLTEEQKTELSKISMKSNEDYLRYWILIGQSKIDEAIDIASFLDDPQLLMYGMTKKIDDIQRDPNLTSEQRTEELDKYKGKLEELKKQYLTTEDTLKDETTSSSSSSSSSGSK